MPIKVRRIDFSPDEWIAGTLGMTIEEEGLYIRIIARIYSRGEALPSDPVELAHLCGVRPQMMRRLLPKLLPKFDETPGKLRSNRCETELKLARNRVETARLNGAKGNISQRLAKAGASKSGAANHHYHHSKEEGLAPYEANPVFLTAAPAGAPPLPSRGDGGAPLRATTTASSGEPEPDPPTVFDDPALKADTVAALDRCLAAIRGKFPEPPADAAPPPPEPRIVRFRQRLVRLNALAGEHLSGDTRLQAWQAIAQADELGDPQALSPAMAAGLAAIEGLEAYAVAAE